MRYGTDMYLCNDEGFGRVMIDDDHHHHHHNYDHVLYRRTT